MVDLKLKVIEVIARYRGIEPQTIGPTSRLDELDIDSLGALTIAFELEEEFALSVPQGKIEELETVGDIIEELRRLLASKTQTPSLS